MFVGTIPDTNVDATTGFKFSIDMPFEGVVRGDRVTVALVPVNTSDSLVEFFISAYVPDTDMVRIVTYQPLYDYTIPECDVLVSVL